MPLLLYTWNRAPNFKVFSYSSCEKPCISSLKNFTRQIFNIFKTDQVINFKRLTILPLPNKAYLGCLSIPYLVYLNSLIKYFSNWLIYSMMWRLFVAAKLLYLNMGLLGALSFSVSIHPSYHPMFPLPNGKHINQGHGIRNIFFGGRSKGFCGTGHAVLSRNQIIHWGGTMRPCKYWVFNCQQLHKSILPVAVLAQPLYQSSGSSRTADSMIDAPIV